MVGSGDTEAGDTTGSARAESLPVVGKIRSFSGSVSIVRANGTAVYAQIGSPLSQGDRIETGGDGRVGISFDDGTEFNLASDARITIGEFGRDGERAPDGAQIQVAQGRFAFAAGKARGFTIDTPLATLRPSPQACAVATLTLVGFTIAMLQKLQAAGTDLITLDELIKYKDHLEHGDLLIVPHGGKPVLLEDPEITIVVDANFVVTTLANSPADMARLLGISADGDNIYDLGLADPFTTGSNPRADTHTFNFGGPNQQQASNGGSPLPPNEDDPSLPPPEGGDGNNNGPQPVLVLTLNEDLIVEHDHSSGVQVDPTGGIDDTDAPFPIDLTDLEGFDQDLVIGQASDGDGPDDDPFVSTAGSSGPVLITVEPSSDGVYSGLDVTGGGRILLFKEFTDGEQVVVGREEGTNEIAFIIFVTRDGEALWVQELLPIEHTDPADSPTNIPNDPNSIASVLDNVLLVRGTLIGTSLTETAPIGQHIVFVDDAPDARNDDLQFAAEDAAGGIGGNVIDPDLADDPDGTGQDVTGTDGATLTHVDIGSGFVAINTGVNLGGGVYQHSNALGAYTFQANGAWTFDPADDVDDPADASFDYRLTDGDGDFDEATQPITVVEGGDPVGGGKLELALEEPDLDLVEDDADLAAGTTTGSTPEGADETDSGTLPFFAGADDLTTFAFGATGGIVVQGLLGSPVITWTGAGTDTIVGKIDGVDAIILHLTASTISAGTNGTVTVTATLVDNFPHALLGADSVLIGGIVVSAAQEDGDFATGQVRVRILDDGPSVDVQATNEALVLLTTQDAETDGDPTSEDPAVSTANFSGVFSIASQSFGADGAGTAPTLGYALSLAVAAGSLSGLSSNGASIRLYDIGGVITGSTAASEDAVDAGNTIFTLSVSGSGVVTQTQYAEVDHAPPGESSPPYDDQFAVLGNGLVNLTASATITDGDTDTAFDSDVIDLGGNIRFADDGPSVDVQATNEALVLLTTQDAETDGDPTSEDPAVSTANFSGVFSIASQSFGADGAGTVPTLGYALSLAVAAGSLSGLSSNGASIRLYDIGGVITGSTAASEDAVDAGNTIFTLSVSGSGVVTQTQYAEVDHAPPGESSPPYDDQFAVLGNGLVNLTASATITDGDTDTAFDSDVIDLGGNIRFADDGPSVDVQATNEALVLLTTQDAETDGDPTSEDPAVSTANFSGVFSIASQSFGADGAGTAPTLGYALSLAVAAGSLSGLSSNGASIRLYDIGGVITGSTAASEDAVDAGNTIFTLSVSGSGVVTQTQYAEVDHAPPGESSPPYDDQFAVLGNGLVNLTASATITDGDTDTAFDSDVIDLGGNIRFADDGPSVDVQATNEALVLLTTQDAETDGDPTSEDPAVSTANFSGVFSIASQSFGADGAGTVPTLGYALSLAVAAGSLSGLSSNGASIRLYDIGGVITGSTAASEDAVDAGNTIFTLSVSGSGVVTQTQYAEVDHAPPGESSPPYDDQFAVLGNGLVNLTASATITDGDTDTAFDSDVIDLGGNIRFADDGPSVDVQATNEALVLLTTQDAETDGDPTSEDPAVSTANFSGVFSIASQSFGADGAGTAPTLGYALSLAVAAGSLSGLSSNGASIRLYDIGGVITGSTAASEDAVDAGNTIFTLSVSGSGVVTQTQYAEVDHAPPGESSPPYDDQFAVLGNGLVNLTASATITDGDTDTAFDSDVIDLGGNIRFADDGPSVDVQATNEALVLLTTQDAETDGDPTSEDPAVSTANFSGVFSIASQSFGADGAGTAPTLGYALSLAVAAGSLSGLSSNGASIRLYDIGGVITGSTAASEDAVDAGNTIFTLSVSGSGVVTQTQYAEVDHAPPGESSPPYDDQFAVLGNGLVNLTASATITDGDTDTAFDSDVIDLGGNIRFADDGPNAVDDDLQEVAEDFVGAIGGNVINPDAADDADASGKDAPGADGATLTHIDIGVGFVLVTSGINLGGGVYQHSNAFGTYTFKADGTWTFDPSVGDPADASFDYRLTDGDGDTDEATQPITVIAGTEKVVANDDIVRTAASGDGSTTVVPEWALLHNDVSTSGNPLDITALGTFSDLNSTSLATNPGSVTIVNNDTDGGSFNYTATGGGETDTAGVTVEIDTGDMSGSGADEILVGTAGAQTIDGKGGEDILIGGTGDTLIGGSGDDLIVYTAGLASVDGESNSSSNLLQDGNRSDVLSVSGTVDFTALADVFEDIETISMLARDGSAGNSTITLNIADVLDMADSGNANPGGDGFGAADALRIDGSAGDVVNLGPDAGTWLLATGATGTPTGYVAYSHVTSGSVASVNEDAYLFVATGVTVNGVGV